TGVVATQRGPVPITWTRDASGSESIDITVPANVTATVQLPALDVHHVNDAGLPVVGDPGVQRATVNQGDVVLTIGSGHYQFANRPHTRPASAPPARAPPSRTLLLVAAIAALVAATAAALELRRRRPQNAHKRAAGRHSETAVKPQHDGVRSLHPHRSVCND